jgi:hypothetical protein
MKILKLQPDIEIDFNPSHAIQETNHLQELAPIDWIKLVFQEIGETILAVPLQLSLTIWAFQKDIIICHVNILPDRSIEWVKPYYILQHFCTPYVYEIIGDH